MLVVNDDSDDNEDTGWVGDAVAIDDIVVDDKEDEDEEEMAGILS